MKYVLVTVGKFKAPFIVAGMDLYRRRITRYTEFSIIPVKEEKISAGCNEALIKQKKREKESSKKFRWTATGWPWTNKESRWPRNSGLIF